MDVGDYLEEHENKDILRFLTAGSVDDGKSTLIGRLLIDSKMVYEDQLASLGRDSKSYGTTGDDFDPALLTDGLKAEREQGITIDVAYRYFSTKKRNFIICDAPGHEQYTRNMATGASRCNLVIILIDSRHGVIEQTKRHSFIASLLGIKHFVVAVNKMDLMEYKQEVFDKIKREYTGFAAKFDVPDIHFIPISALKGDNVVTSSEKMKWFSGAPLLSYLEEVQIANDRNLIDLRLPVQYVIRPNLNFRGYAGTISSGTIREGDDIVVLPRGEKTQVKKVHPSSVGSAFASQSVVVETTTEVDISRGDMLVHPNNLPRISVCFDAMIVWMQDNCLESGKTYLLKMNFAKTPASIIKVQYKYDVNKIERSNSSYLGLNDIGRVAIELHREICYDAYSSNRETGSFILIDRMTNATAGAGVILRQSVSQDEESKKSFIKRFMSFVFRLLR